MEKEWVFLCCLAYLFNSKKKLKPCQGLNARLFWAVTVTLPRDNKHIQQH